MDFLGGIRLKKDAGHAFYIGDFFVEKEIQNQEETLYLKVPLFQFWRFQCVCFSWVFDLKQHEVNETDESIMWGLRRHLCLMIQKKYLLFFLMLAIGQQQSNICDLVSLFQRKIIRDYDKYFFFIGGLSSFWFFSVFSATETWDY